MHPTGATFRGRSEWIATSSISYQGTSAADLSAAEGIVDSAVIRP